MPEQGRWDGREYQYARRTLYRKRIPFCEHPECFAPHIPIDYDGPRYVVNGDGRRILNPWAFEADHVIPRAEGGGDGPLRACHARCNRTAGAKLGGKRLWARRKRAAAGPGPIHTRQW